MQGDSIIKNEKTSGYMLGDKTENIKKRTDFIEASGELQEGALEEIEEGYVEVDLKGNTVACNSSFCKITGYPKEELLGLNYREYMTCLLYTSPSPRD